VKLSFFAVTGSALVLLAAGVTPVQAGEPIFVTADGRPYRYDFSQPLRYVVGAGPLGRRSHAEGVALVKEALRRWAAVPTARLRLEDAGDLPAHVDSGNILQFLNEVKPTDPSPILFDNDGAMLEQMLGKGAAQEDYGYASPLRADPARGQLLVSFAILVGSSLAPYGDGAALQGCIHEMGHFVGLGHSQLNGDVWLDGDPDNDARAPAMSYGWGPNAMGHLHREDEAWLSWLYPSPEFAAQTGSIRGRVLLPDRVTGLVGVLVVARRQGDPQVTAVSGVSGYLFGAVDGAIQEPGRPGSFWPIRKGPDAGASDPARMGEFLIPGLPPGSYTLELQQVDGRPGLSRRGFLIGGPKYWRQDTSPAARATDATPLGVAAGQEVKGIDIVVNGQDLGEPRPITAQPNSSSGIQQVTLPAVVTGSVEAGGDGVSTLIRSTLDLDALYRVTLPDWTTVTAVLSAAQLTADLDLYLYTSDAQLLAAAIVPGSAPEVLQQRLPPGDYVFGIHHSGGPGSAYTLRLLATPAPEWREPQELMQINYLLVGDVTATGAVLQWQTTTDSAGVVYYGQPLREIGSPQRGREHNLTLRELPAGQSTPLQVVSQPGLWVLDASFTTATRSNPGGTPRIVTGSGAPLAPFKSLGRDTSVATVHMSNAGDSDALKVQIDSVTLAPGWEVLSQAQSGTSLPATLELGRIGAGGEGIFRVTLVRGSGAADPGITVHGSYTDAGGKVWRF
jgi:hypothetical protein